MKTTARDFFQGLPAGEAEKLFQLAEVRCLQKGEPIIREGAQDRTAYLILSGEVRVFKDFQGSPQTLARLRAGDWIGEIAFLHRTSRTASAVAAEPASVLALTPGVLESLTAATQLFLYKKFHELASERIRILERAASSLNDRSERLMEAIRRERGRRTMDMDQSEILKEIVRKVPRLPAFAGSLAIRLISDGAALTPAEVTDQIRRDPALAAMVLRAVNSSYYGLRSKVSDIHHAVMLFGYNELYQLILAEGVRKVMPDTLPFQQLHVHCVAVSCLAYELARHSGKSTPVLAGTVGLLHAIGEVVLAFLLRRNPKLEVLIDGLDRAQLGGALLRSWNLPEVVWKSVAMQEEPEVLPPDAISPPAREPAILLHLAHLSLQVLDGSETSPLPAPFAADHLRHCGWPNGDLREVAEGVLLPGLAKRRESLPLPLRRMVGEKTRHERAYG